MKKQSKRKLKLGVVHLGASSLHGAVVGIDGKLHHSNASYESNGSRQKKTYEEILDEVIDEFISLENSSNDQLDHLVTTIPMPVDPEFGVSEVAPALHQVVGRQLRTDLANILSSKLERKISVFVENDANASGLRSLKFGVAKNYNSALYIRISTGVGGCLIQKGELVRGSRNLAGEIGHITLQRFGRPCGCGSRGCVETLVGGNALMHMLGREKGQSERSFSHFRDAIEASNAGDAIVKSELENMGAYFGIAIASAVNLLNPEIVVVSGAMLDENGTLIEKAKSEFKERVSVGFECNIECERCEQSSHAMSGLSTFLFQTGSKYESNSI